MRYEVVPIEGPWTNDDFEAEEKTAPDYNYDEPLGQSLD
jgi:hypothetical protein